MTAFGAVKKRRRDVPRISWCDRHRAEQSYSDERGLRLCWKAEQLFVSKPCRFVTKQLADQTWWCETHKTFSIANELNPELTAVQCWWSKTFEPEPCQMQERLTFALLASDTAPE